MKPLDFLLPRSVVGADTDLTQVPTFDCPTTGGCYPDPCNWFKVIALGHMKSAEGQFGAGNNKRAQQALQRLLNPRLKAPA